MRWFRLGQQYVGQWQDGVQVRKQTEREYNPLIGSVTESVFVSYKHGRGTHVWMLRKMELYQYCQNNQYTGEFVQGQRHGQGTFYYVGGAMYEGGWRYNKKHGQVGWMIIISDYFSFLVLQQP